MKYLLYPFSVIYFLITSLRNFLFDHSLFFFKPQKFDVYTVCVGNLSVGGTGKTPFIEYLVRLLADKYKVATLSRGYGRRTKGIIVATKESTALEIGDEPAQFLHKFHPKIHVVVGEERTIAIPHLLSRFAETQVILLDDAFQHRKVSADFNIVLTDYHKLFFKDFLLPMGRLRESRTGINRANAIVVTKCPEDISYKMEYIRKKIQPYIAKEGIPIFFTSIKYGNPISIDPENSKFDSTNKIVLVTGIANAAPLKKYVSKYLKLFSHLEFGDHHQYSGLDFEKIISKFKLIKSPQKCILTTEKDMMKWLDEHTRQLLTNIPVFYIPIEMHFIENEPQFQSLVLKGLK
ncbi:MAG: tetraacyldisaccharide 4'-kinase [Cytophagales bacterium]